jgi:hypothetical protein
MPFFTTHSAIDSYRTCPYKRYLNYHHLKTGIVPTSKSIPLTTGSEVHTGITYILNVYRNGAAILDSTVDMAVEKALSNYSRLWDKVELDDIFTYYEQRALIEALIRTWVLVELPNIFEFFTVLDVEREIPFPLDENGDIILGSRADAILQHKQTKDIVVYSLKTMKRWDTRALRSYKKGSQVVTETEAVRWLLAQQESAIGNVLNSITNNDIHGVLYAVPKMREIFDYLLHRVGQSNPKNIGVKFCFLIKGNREDKNLQSDWDYQTSPLITGYKKFTPSGIEYAHTNKTVKPENKSGFGKLGKGWEKFNVWEEESLGMPDERVKNWINLLNNQYKLTTSNTGGVNIGYVQIQVELAEIEGNILKQQIITPSEIYPTKDRVDKVLEEIKEQEGAIRHILSHDTFDSFFYKNDRSCHWPTNCQYLPICWGESVNSDTPFDVSLDDVLTNGVYERRKPHYELEDKYNPSVVLFEVKLDVSAADDDE